ncbi:hypothetical protein FQA39_LY11143 [Lamprigera yunnana]|nr:hypothetical protein FQA39_LY11143 [Lamprigera yunnana]
MPRYCETMLSDLDTFPSVQLGDFTLKFDFDDLTPELKEVAKKELRETPERRKQAIAELQDLLKEETDFWVPLDHEGWLVKFLRPCKYYPENACQLIKRYYQFKVKHADVYDGLVPSQEANIFNHDILTVQPNRDQFGRRVLIIELGKKWKHKQCSLDDVFKGCVIFLEAAAIEPNTQVAGAVVIFDMDGLTLQQTWQFTPSFAKRIVDWLQDAIPIRLKNIHIVNEPYIFNIVFNLFKPFLREKLKKRIIFHGNDRKSLHQYISPECLNECYGGTVVLPRISGPQWHELLKFSDKEYAAINSYGYKKKRGA